MPQIHGVLDNMTGNRKKMLIIWDIEFTCSFNSKVAQSIIKEKEKDKLKIVALQEIMWE